MEKCLVTKLQGKVSGDLPYLGALKITVKKTDNITLATQRRLVLRTSDDNCRIFTADGSIKLSDKEDLSNPSSSFVFKNMYRPSSSDNKREIYFLDGDYTVYITSKYNIKLLNNWGETGNFLYDIEELKYSHLLTDLRIQHLNVTGDISSLSGLTALTNLILNNINVTGDISSLKDLTALTNLQLNNTKNTGTFESHVSALSAKRTSGSCLYWLSGSNITYKGERWITGKKLVEFNSVGCEVYDYSTDSKGSKIASYVKSTNTWSYNN